MVVALVAVAAAAAAPATPEETLGAHAARFVASLAAADRAALDERIARKRSLAAVPGLLPALPDHFVATDRRRLEDAAPPCGAWEHCPYDGYYMPLGRRRRGRLWYGGRRDDAGRFETCSDASDTFSGSSTWTVLLRDVEVAATYVDANGATSYALRVREAEHGFVERGDDRFAAEGDTEWNSAFGYIENMNALEFDDWAAAYDDEDGDEGEDRRLEDADLTTRRRRASPGRKRRPRRRRRDAIGDGAWEADDDWTAGECGLWDRDGYFEVEPCEYGLAAVCEFDDDVFSYSYAWIEGVDVTTDEACAYSPSCTCACETCADFLEGRCGTDCAVDEAEEVYVYCQCADHDHCTAENWRKFLPADPSYYVLRVAADGGDACPLLPEDHARVESGDSQLRREGCAVPFGDGCEDGRCDSELSKLDDGAESCYDHGLEIEAAVLGMGEPYSSPAVFAELPRVDVAAVDRAAKASSRSPWPGSPRAVWTTGAWADLVGVAGAGGCYEAGAAWSAVAVAAGDAAYDDDASCAALCDATDGCDVWERGLFSFDECCELKAARGSRPAATRGWASAGAAACADGRLALLDGLEARTPGDADVDDECWVRGLGYGADATTPACGAAALLAVRAGGDAGPGHRAGLVGRRGAGGDGRRRHGRGGLPRVLRRDGGLRRLAPEAGRASPRRRRLRAVLGRIYDYDAPDETVSGVPGCVSEDDLETSSWFDECDSPRGCYFAVVEQPAVVDCLEGTWFLVNGGSNALTFFKWLADQVSPDLFYDQTSMALEGVAGATAWAGANFVFYTQCMIWYPATSRAGATRRDWGRRTSRSATRSRDADAVLAVAEPVCARANAHCFFAPAAYNTRASGGGLPEILKPKAHLIDWTGLVTDWIPEEIVDGHTTPFPHITAYNMIWNTVCGDLPAAGCPEYLVADKLCFDATNGETGDWVMASEVDYCTYARVDAVPVSVKLQAPATVAGAAGLADCLWNALGLGETGGASGSSSAKELCKQKNRLFCGGAGDGWALAGVGFGVAAPSRRGVLRGEEEAAAPARGDEGRQGLGGARYVASVHIVLGHLFAKGAVDDVYLYGWGYTWVPFFFMLSGYVLAHSRLASRDPSKVERPTTYLAKRLATVYPAYAVGLFLALGVRVARGVALPETKWMLYQAFLLQAFDPRATEQVFQFHPVPLQAMILVGLSPIDAGRAKDPVAAAFAKLPAFFGDISYPQYVLQFVAYSCWPTVDVDVVPFLLYLTGGSALLAYGVVKPAAAIWRRFAATRRRAAMLWSRPGRRRGLAIAAAAYDADKAKSSSSSAAADGNGTNATVWLAAEALDVRLNWTSTRGALINPSLLLVDGDIVRAARAHSLRSERGEGAYRVPGESFVRIVVEETASWSSDIVLAAEPYGGNLSAPFDEWRLWDLDGSLATGAPATLSRPSLLSHLGDGAAWGALCEPVAAFYEANNTVVRKVVGGPEDPKLVGLPGGAWGLAFNSYPPKHLAGNCDGKARAVSQMYLARNGAALAGGDDAPAVRLACGETEADEKNWIAFTHNDMLHFTSFSPLAAVAGDVAVRGSATAAPYGGNYLALLHTLRDGAYETLAYEFAGAPPFGITRVSRPIELQGGGAAFPSALLYAQGKVVAYGSDSVSWPKKTLEMVPSKASPRIVPRSVCSWTPE
ncbi:hypothetical protein JL720_4622 [Aureococcus anophagefferens]|nr:hypothetical protein JL720_4622 [Aureococcus anophagefferens]